MLDGPAGIGTSLVVIGPTVVARRPIDRARSIALLQPRNAIAQEGMTLLQARPSRGKVATRVANLVLDKSSMRYLFATIVPLIVLLSVPHFP